MPTKKQLFDIWKSQFVLFGGSGIPRESNPNLTDGLGQTEEQFTDTPHNILEVTDNDDEGDIIGVVEYDPITDELRINLNS